MSRASGPATRTGAGRMPQRVVLLVALEGFVALGAWAGTVGFATGAFDQLLEQLPLDSRGLAGSARTGASCGQRYTASACARSSGGAVPSRSQVC